MSQTNKGAKCVISLLYDHACVVSIVCKQKHIEEKTFSRCRCGGKWRLRASSWKSGFTSDNVPAESLNRLSQMCKRLVDDWEAVTRNKQLLKLPHKVC